MRDLEIEPSGTAPGGVEERGQVTMNDNKVRCRCCSGTCTCERNGVPVPVPANLPGRVAALTASTRARRPARSTSVPVRRTPTQQAKALAAKEQFFRSSPPSERRKAGLPPHPENPGPVMVAAAVPWRYPRTLTASGRAQQFYVTQDAEDRAYREALDTARRVAHLESGNLPGEALTGAQEGACAAYAKLLTAGAIDEAARVMDTLRGSARRVRQQRLRKVMDAQAVRLLGPTGALVASAQRERMARVDRLADRLFGKEEADRRRQMRRLRQRVDRTRFTGGGSAA